MLSINTAPLFEKYKGLLLDLKKGNGLDFEISLFVPASSYSVVSLKDGVLTVSSKDSSKIFNALEATKIYTLVLLKNKMEISHKENTKAFNEERLKKISAVILPRFENELKPLFSALEPLKKKNKSKLSDEEKHKLNSLTKEFDKSSTMLKTMMADFVKVK